MQLISQAMETFSVNDPDENLSLKGTSSVADAIHCYKELHSEKQAVKSQQSLDDFLTKSRRKPN